MAMYLLWGIKYIQRDATQNGRALCACSGGWSCLCVWRDLLCAQLRKHAMHEGGDLRTILPHKIMLALEIIHDGGLKAVRSELVRHGSRLGQIEQAVLGRGGEPKRRVAGQERLQKGVAILGGRGLRPNILVVAKGVADEAGVVAVIAAVEIDEVVDARDADDGSGFGEGYATLRLPQRIAHQKLEGQHGTG